MFGLTTAALLWGVLFVAIGSGYFIYGRRQGEPIEMLTGAGLVGMTFVVTSSLWIVVLGLLLCLLPCCGGASPDLATPAIRCRAS